MTVPLLPLSTMQNRSEQVSAERRIGVCHVSLTLCTGGLERLLVDFARFHDRRRYALTFVVLGETGRPAEEIRQCGCPVIGPPDSGSGRLRRILWLAGLLKQSGATIVHTHNQAPHLLGSLAARWAGLPIVVQTRHGPRFGHTRKERLQFALASRLSDRVIGVSEDTSTRCRQTGWLPASRVQTIVNGIDVERFAYRGPASAPVAIAVARLSPEKDFPTLLEAAALAKERVPEFRLRIVGDGPERDRLEHLAARSPVNCVEFLGERHDVPELLGRAAMYVSSSRAEGISLTLLEAMAVGLPAVVTAVGGNPEVVLPDVTGWLVPKY